MKKIENALIDFAQYLDKNCPNFFTLFIFLLCGIIAYLIHKYRKKDAKDIEKKNCICNDIEKQSPGNYCGSCHSK